MNFSSRHSAPAATLTISLTGYDPAERVVVDDYLLAIDQADARLAELDAQLAAVADNDSRP